MAKLSPKQYITISLKPAKLLQGIAGTAAGYISGNVGTSAKGALDICEALDSSDPAKALLSELLGKALATSIAELLADHQATLKLDSDRIGRFVAEGALGDTIALEVPADILESPTESIFLVELLAHLKAWLAKVGLRDEDSANLIERVRHSFAGSILREWRSRPTHYSGISPALSSPLDKVVKREFEKRAYRNSLYATPDQPVFDETFSLRQIYVPLRCTIEKMDQGAKSDDTELDYHALPQHDVTWLKEEVSDWLDAKDGPPICLISGGPGSGKSSFAKMLAADLAGSSINVLFIPLHLLDVGLTLSKSIDDFLESSERFSEPVLDELLKSDLTLLIFDGLDELQLQGKAAQEVAQTFVGELLRFLEVKNSQRNRIKTVVTGRDVAVQSTEMLVRTNAHIVHVAPYAFPDRHPYQLDRSKPLVKLDQRDSWWVQYSRLSGSNFEKMPKELSAGELNDVSIQPLLNYLVALSMKEGLIVGKGTDINEVYAYLVKAVFRRGWEKNPHPALKDVSEESFVRLLEEVAVSVWHGTGRTTTLRDIGEQCQKAGISKLLPSLKKGAEEGVSKLLLAFYFRQKGVGSEGDRTFEFTHKSFAEYLISLRIVRLMDQIDLRLREHEGDAEAGWDIQNCLVRWIEIMGAAAIDEYIMAFLRREVVSREPSKVLQWQATISKLLNYTLAHRLPMHRVGPATFRDATVRDRNAEEALFVALNACARTTKSVTRLSAPTKTAVAETLRRLQGQRVSSANRPVMSSLSYLVLDSCGFDMMDFYSADLSHSSLRNAALAMANFGNANLTDTDLRDALFFRTRFDTHLLDRAKFSAQSDLSFALEPFADRGPPTRNPEKQYADLVARGAIVEGYRPKRRSRKRSN